MHLRRLFLERSLIARYQSLSPIQPRLPSLRRLAALDPIFSEWKPLVRVLGSPSSHLRIVAEPQRARHYLQVARAIDPGDTLLKYPTPLPSPFTIPQTLSFYKLTYLLIKY